MCDVKVRMENVDVCVIVCLERGESLLIVVV